MRSKAATRSSSSVPSTIAPANRFWSARDDPFLAHATHSYGHSRLNRAHAERGVPQLEIRAFEAEPLVMQEPRQALRALGENVDPLTDARGMPGRMRCQNRA